MKVFLESEEYGYEEFEADNISEAILKLRSLARGCLAFHKEDKIERKVGIKIGQEGEEAL